MRYLHTMLRVRNLDAALEFYVKKLGLKEARRIDNEQGRFTLVFLAASEDEGLVAKSAPSGFAAPLRTKALTPTFAMMMRSPSTTLPCARSWSINGAAFITRSATSPF